MKNYFESKKAETELSVNLLQRFSSKSRHLVLKAFNKSIYTRILITNVFVFLVVLTILALFANFMMKEVAYDQLEQDLLRKAVRVNFALTQENLMDTEQNVKMTEQDLLKFMADSFDTRITVFDSKGIILRTSAEQEVVPGSKINPKFIDIFNSSETLVLRTTNKETGQLTINAAIPMGNTEEPVVNGILLETETNNLDLALSKMIVALLTGGAIILIIIIAVSSYLAMSISMPISRFSKNLGNLSRGSFVVNDEKQSLSEINILAGLINTAMEKLERVQSESERIEGERAQLFSEISHELRTPLTAVQGFTEAIRDGMVEDEIHKKKYLDMIHTQTLHIARLVDDLLALSRLESGDVTVEKHPLDLIALTQGVVLSMEGIAKGKNDTILFESEIQKVVVIGDVDRMEQILRNLLKNAIRATKDGEITVHVKADREEVCITIEDNGIGIPMEDLPHIWDRFYRARNQRSNNSDEKNTGLGLLIVKKLVQLQGGKINAESQLGKGTSFTMSFPIFNAES